MEFDAIIVGGSFAGMSAAMQLVRARRQVLLIDAGRPRNRFAKASHGFFGLDGVPPADIRDKVRGQLSAYPSFNLREGLAEEVEAIDGGFAVTMAGGERARASRLLLATGVRDTLPEVPGLPERWGQSVFHCPYCHGYEIGGGEIGLLMSSPMGLHQAMMLPDWGQVSVFTQGMEIPGEDRARLAARNVAIEECPVVELLGNDTALEAVRLADHRTVPLRGLFVQPKTDIVSPLAAQLGLELEDGPTGAFIKTFEHGRTSREGIFAAGDAATAWHNATFASAAGVAAGVNLHRSLIEAETPTP